ncbi:MAG: tandem-95 repeat protein, partial [bacterium]|nr:tandem-95 repeat protein [bacterium]
TSSPETSVIEETAYSYTLTATDEDLADILVYTDVSSPAIGWLTFNPATQVLEGTAPSSSDVGNPFNVRLRVFDGKDEVFDVFTITVMPVNSTPSADDQSKAIAEDTAVAITLTGSDLDGDPITFAVASVPGNGSLSGTVPNLTYTPNANFHGSDSFTYIANDGMLDSAPATVSITVNPVNDAPTADDQSKTTTEDTAVAITLTGSDIDGDTISFVVVSSLAHGSLSGIAPNLSYIPNRNFHGTDSFTYKSNDGQLDSTLATVSITVEPANDTPVADNQNKTTAEDTAVAITLTGSDIDGDVLNFVVISGPGSGSLSGTPPNLSYTPDANFHGSDNFTYLANDGSLDSAPATVNITIQAANDAPTADDQIKTTDEDTAVAIILTGSDIEGSSLTFTVASGPSNGALSGVAPNLSYTPNANFHGSDSFTYRSNDGLLDSAPATVSITVDPVNDAPVADSQNKVTAEDTAVAITLTGSDIDGDTISFTVVSGPGNGSLSGTAPDLTYTPNVNFHGSDSFTYRSNDGLLDSAPATVSITVNAANDAPTADDQIKTTAEDTAVAITLTGSDLEGDALTFAVASGPGNGTLSGISPNLSYTPNANFHGSDSFTYIANDGLLDSAPATVNITVTPVNDAPVADSQNKITAEETAVAITLTGSDVDGDAISFTILTNPGNGSLSGTAPNLTYTPNANFHGSDSFTYRSND